MLPFFLYQYLKINEPLDVIAHLIHANKNDLLLQNFLVSQFLQHLILFSLCSFFITFFVFFFFIWCQNKKLISNLIHLLHMLNNEIILILHLTSDKNPFPFLQLLISHQILLPSMVEITLASFKKSYSTSFCVQHVVISILLLLLFLLSWILYDCYVY